MDVTARMVRGPLIRLSRIPPDHADPPPTTVRRLRSGPTTPIWPSKSSREDDLTAGGHRVELTDGDDVHDLFDQVLLGRLEQSVDAH